MTDDPNLDEVAHDLEDAGDGDLIRIVYHRDAEEVDIEDGGTLTHQAMATLELRERGFAIDGALDDVEVRDTEGNVLRPEDVEDYQGGG